MALTAKQRNDWRDNGFLVFPGFFDEAEVSVVTDTLASVWTDRPATITVDDLVTGERKHASQVDDADAAEHTFKVNDLYLEFPEIRGVALSERIGVLLRELLDDLPVMCNTLNLEKGSQQADHLDTLYMTPATPDKLVATWMALEDVRPDAGPLQYWPGSNHIPTYRFSDGGMHTIAEEMDRWAEYMADQTEKLGLEQQTFLARRGDLFVWHAALLHGGSKIATSGLTRNSLVTHFWANQDCAAMPTAEAPGGKWTVRPPQPVPSDAAELTDVERELAERAADERAVTAVRDGVPQIPKRSLVDRMRQLAFSRD